MESANDPAWFVRFLDRTSPGPGEHHPAVSAGRDGLTFLVAEAARLPFASSSFDAAWVKRTLMHLADPGG